MHRFLVYVILLFAVTGCGSGGSKFSEKDLPGMWELDFKTVSIDIMGPKMGPNFYQQTYSRMRLTAEFKPGGELIITEGASTGSGSSSAAKDGTWKVSNPGAQPLKVSLSTKEGAEDVVVKFIDADRIEMPGPPKLFPNGPVKRVQFMRSK